MQTITASGNYDEVSALRHEFLVADLVLESALARFSEGEIEPGELDATLEEHRQAYLAYLSKIHETLLRMMTSKVPAN